MNIQNKKLIWLLAIIIAVLVGYVIYGEIIAYGTRMYARGQEDGQLVLASDQRRGYVMFFNGTDRWVNTFDEICQLYKCGGA